MNYPCYPITKPKDAFVMVGQTKVKLPRPKWNIHSWGKNIECSYHVENGRGRSVIHLQAETHWGNPITIYLDLQKYGGSKKQLEEQPWLAVDVNWSSGGTNPGYTAAQIAETMAKLWTVAHEITRRLQNNVFCWAASKE